MNSEKTGASASSRKGSRSNSGGDELATSQQVQHNYHDRANVPPDPADDLSRYRQPYSLAAPFPLKLHDTLDRIEQDGYAQVIAWQPHGRCFVIHDPEKFKKEILPTYFGSPKMTSFTRQLNLYGFQRITTGKDRNGYYHEYFLRGKAYLTIHITRTRVKGTGVRLKTNPQDEPDFWSMAWVVGDIEQNKSSKEEDAKARASIVPSPSAAPIPTHRQQIQQGSGQEVFMPSQLFAKNPSGVKMSILSESHEESIGGNAEISGGGRAAVVGTELQRLEQNYTNALSSLEAATDNRRQHDHQRSNRHFAKRGDRLDNEGTTPFISEHPFFAMDDYGIAATNGNNAIPSFNLEPTPLAEKQTQDSTGTERRREEANEGTRSYLETISPGVAADFLDIFKGQSHDRVAMPSLPENRERSDPSNSSNAGSSSKESLVSILKPDPTLQAQQQRANDDTCLGLPGMVSHRRLSEKCKESDTVQFPPRFPSQTGERDATEALLSSASQKMISFLYQASDQQRSSRSMLQSQSPLREVPPPPVPSTTTGNLAEEEPRESLPVGHEEEAAKATKDGDDVATQSLGAASPQDETSPSSFSAFASDVDDEALGTL